MKRWGLSFTKMPLSQILKRWKRPSKPLRATVAHAGKSKNKNNNVLKTKGCHFSNCEKHCKRATSFSIMSKPCLKGSCLILGLHSFHLRAGGLELDVGGLPANFLYLQLWLQSLLSSFSDSSLFTFFRVYILLKPDARAYPDLVFSYTPHTSSDLSHIWSCWRLIEHSVSPKLKCPIRKTRKCRHYWA